MTSSSLHIVNNRLKFKLEKFLKKKFKPGMKIKEAASLAGKSNSDVISIHAGTNNVDNSSPEQLCEDVVETLNKVQANNPKARIGFSSIFRRKDDQNLHTKVTKVNTLLEDELALNGIDIIDNSNILFSNLWKDGLHINDGEVRKSSGNPSRFIKYCEGSLSSEKDIESSSRVCNPSKRKRNGLKIAFLNIVSLRKHRHELEITLKEQDFDIIGLSETRLDSKITDNEVKIDGYNLFRKDRNRNGGGVAIYVKESLPPPVVKLKSDTLELVSLEIKQNHAKPFLVVSWYQPPTDGVDETAFESLRHVLIDLQQEKEIILLMILTAISK